MALFGSWADLSRFSQLPDILGHFNVADEVWNATVLNLGDPGNSIGLFSAIPRGAVVAASDSCVRERPRRGVAAAMARRPLHAFGMGADRSFGLHSGTALIGMVARVAAQPCRGGKGRHVSRRRMLESSEDSSRRLRSRRSSSFRVRSESTSRLAEPGHHQHRPLHALWGGPGTSSSPPRPRSASADATTGSPIRSIATTAAEESTPEPTEARGSRASMTAPNRPEWMRVVTEEDTAHSPSGTRGRFVRLRRPGRVLDQMLEHASPRRP